MKGCERVKKLICAKDIEDAATQGQTVCYIDSNTIVTPAARDAAKVAGITLKEGPAPAPAPVSDAAVIGCLADAKVPASEPVKASGSCGIDSELIYSVLKMLLQKGSLNGIVDLPDQKPYACDSDPGGLKVVRGGSVKMDVFDTGDPNVKAYYQELVSKEESKMSAGFLVIDHSDFEWELTYEEIDYVIEGTLTVTLDGRTFTAHAGDVLFVPSGSRVVWGSPDRARVFYTTYPANWADLL